MKPRQSVSFMTEPKPLNIGRELSIAFAAVLFVPMIVMAVFFVTYYSAKTEDEAVLRLRSGLKAAEILFRNSVNDMRHLTDTYARNNAIVLLLPYDMGLKLGRGLSDSEIRNIRDSFIFPERRQYESLVYMKVKRREKAGTCDYESGLSAEGRA